MNHASGAGTIEGAKTFIVIFFVGVGEYRSCSKNKEKVVITILGHSHSIIHHVN